MAGISGGRAIGVRGNWSRNLFVNQRSAEPARHLAREGIGLPHRRGWGSRGVRGRASKVIPFAPTLSATENATATSLVDGIVTERGGESHCSRDNLLIWPLMMNVTVFLLITWMKSFRPCMGHLRRGKVGAGHWYTGVSVSWSPSMRPGLWGTSLVRI
jgi:hypothetical protein